MSRFFRGKPAWDNGYKLNEETGQWTPPPQWATHILFAKTSGVYAWAEKSATGEYVGEPRYRGGVQSRDCFTVGPDGWQVVEARPAQAAQSNLVAITPAIKTTLLLCLMDGRRAVLADPDNRGAAWVEESLAALDAAKAAIEGQERGNG